MVEARGEPSYLPELWGRTAAWGRIEAPSGWIVLVDEGAKDLLGSLGEVDSLCVWV